MVAFDEQELRIVRQWIEERRERPAFTFKGITDRFVETGMDRKVARRVARNLGEKIRASVEDPTDVRLPIRVREYLQPQHPRLRGGSILYFYAG